MTAPTTAGRVPLLDPGREYTLMPRMSLGETKVRHESLSVDLPASFRNFPDRPWCARWVIEA